MARGAAGSGSAAGRIEQQQLKTTTTTTTTTTTKTKTKTKKLKELSKKKRRRKKAAAVGQEVEVERALETLRLPSGVSFDMLRPELKAELRRRVMEQCGGARPVRCPRCRTSEALVLRYFNNRRSPGQLQPRFRCSNPRSCCCFFFFLPSSSSPPPLLPRHRRPSSSCVEFYFKPGPGPAPAGPILTRKTRDLFFSAADIGLAPPSLQSPADQSSAAVAAARRSRDDRAGNLNSIAQAPAPGGGGGAESKSTGRARSVVRQYSWSTDEDDNSAALGHDHSGSDSDAGCSDAQAAPSISRLSSSTSVIDKRQGRRILTSSTVNLQYRSAAGRYNLDKHSSPAKRKRSTTDRSSSEDEDHGQEYHVQDVSSTSGAWLYKYSPPLAFTTRRHRSGLRRSRRTFLGRTYSCPATSSSCDHATTTIISTLNAAARDAVPSDDPDQQLTSSCAINEFRMSRAESSALAPIAMTCAKQITGRSSNEYCIAAAADDDDDDDDDRYIHAALSSSVDAMTSDGFADLLRTFEDESLEDQFDDTHELPPADHRHPASSANLNLGSHAAGAIFRTSFSSQSTSSSTWEASDHDRQNGEPSRARSASITGRTRDPFLCLPISHPSIVSALGPTQLVFSL